MPTRPTPRPPSAPPGGGPAPADAVRPLAVAHRGDPYRHRENTLPSLASAVRAGADAVEVDVRTTADGVPVLLHDRTLDRLWGRDVPIGHLSAEQARRIGLPTLREALATVPGRLLVDLPDATCAPAVVAEVHACRARDQVYYCGGVRALLRVRAADPDAEIALTWNRTATPAAPLLERIRPHWLNLPFALATTALTDRVHASGLRVGVWTVDRPRTMAALLDRGVDAITTNRIAALTRLTRHRSALTSW